MTSTQALLGDVSPVIGRLGASYYFTPETLARGKDAGLDGFRFYFLGRGGVLGDVEAAVVASAFGYFEPGLVATMWDSARQTVAPRDAGRLHLSYAYDLGRARLSGLSQVGGFCRAAQAVVEAADPSGLALYAGFLGEPVPEDDPARAMHLVVLLRELRGSAHLLAVHASGVSPKAAHYLKRPDDFGLFGWKEADIPAVTDEERRGLQQAETLTDRLLAPAYDVLDDEGSAALADGLAAMVAAIEAPAPGD